MSRRKLWTTFIWSVPALLCALACANVAAAQKAIKKDEARKLIAALSLLELNQEAVTIEEISPPGVSATVLADVKLAFRFARDAGGSWRVSEVRTGDRRWESFDLLARALGEENGSLARAELDAFAAELDARGKHKSKTAREGESKAAAGTSELNSGDELKRGALSVKNPADAISAIGSSAVVEVEIETSVDFVRDGRGRWQVARVRLGGRSFAALAAAELALGAEKLARARADLEQLAAALEAYRRERGFYVVAASASVLGDQLNPRDTAAFIRVDPWHRPYEYAGTRERYTLRSLGADGKANTADDVTIMR